MASGDGNESERTTPDQGGQRDELRLRRQAERIREMERLMRAAAAFARGRPPR